MLAQLAGLGLTIGGTLFGMRESNDAAERAAAAAREAAKQQVAGLNNAIGERRTGLDSTLSYLKPYEETGRAGMATLSDALGINGPERQQAYFAAFQTDPGFMASQKAGVGAIEQSQAGGGLLRSGGTLKGLYDYGQKNMMGMFSDRLNRLAGVGASGQQAAGSMAGFNSAASSDVAGYLRDIGVANAGGTIGASNADQRGTQNMLTMLGYGMGQARGGINDLLGQFKMPSSGGGNLGFIPGLGNFKAGF